GTGVAPARKQPVGATQQGVLLVQRRRHLQQPGRQQRGERGIAAEADHGGGVEPPHQGQRRRQTAEHGEPGGGGRQRGSTRDGGRGNRVDGAGGEVRALNLRAPGGGGGDLD